MALNHCGICSRISLFAQHHLVFSSQIVRRNHTDEMVRQPVDAIELALKQKIVTPELSTACDGRTRVLKNCKIYSKSLPLRSTKNRLSSSCADDMRPQRIGLKKAWAVHITVVVTHLRIPCGRSFVMFSLLADNIFFRSAFVLLFALVPCCNYVLR